MRGFAGQSRLSCTLNGVGSGRNKPPLDTYVGLGICSFHGQTRPRRLAVEILFIIMLAPIALFVGLGLIRLMMEPAFWIAVGILIAVIGLVTAHPH